ncbi:MAG: hypothetical protein K2H45_05050, partial [Acetatifactor sp.]|nr:hypothetical protein [Acetatifactor sp.]
MIEQLNNNEHIRINLFGKEKDVEVFSNDYDSVAFSEEEIACLNWFIENVDIADYKKEIVAWCNEQYEIFSDEVIGEEDLEEELDIFAIAINS